MPSGHGGGTRPGGRPARRTRHRPAEPLSEAALTEMWRGLLLGEDSTLKRLRTVFNRLPGTPRCKVCAAPFRGPARMVTRIAMHGSSPENPLMCGVCMWSLRRRPGGAEVPGSVLFADVRGSTGLAEGRTAAQYHRLLQRFYALAATAIERHRGILDKFLGDGVMALYIPLTAGDGHARAAVDTARDILAALRRADGDLAALGVGCGVHTGDMFVGALGTDDRVDFSALGDTVNIAARLGSIAGPGEALVSRAAWEAAGRPLPEDVTEAVTVTGRSAPLDVVRLALAGGDGAAPVAAAAGAGPPPAAAQRTK